MNRLERGKRILRVGLLCLLTVVFAGMFFVDPSVDGVHICAFNRLTGLSCPTCGLTRSVHSFMHGRLGESFRFHLMGPVVMTFLWLLWGYWLSEIVTGKVWTLKINRVVARWSLIGIFSTWMLYWMARLIFGPGS